MYNRKEYRVQHPPFVFGRVCFSKNENCRLKNRRCEGSLHMGIFSSLFHLNRYMLLARVVIILLILPLHEFAHGWMARRFGDDTAEANGRLTLNPLMHLDPLGSVLLLFTGFGWAKPVPINPARMNNPRKGIIWTSLAGPFSNLLAALLGVILLQVEFPFYAANAGSAVLLAIHYFLSGFVTVNISLAVFNLIPIPPFDGSRIALAFLPDRIYFGIMRYERQIMFGLLIVMLVLSNFGYSPIGYVATKLPNLIGNPIAQGIVNLLV